MPFPIHPRPGLIISSTIHPNGNQQQQNCLATKSPQATFPGRNILLASISTSLAIAILVIFIFQFRPFDMESSEQSAAQFSEIRIKEGDKEFAIFGRRLAMGSGDYFLDIPYALGTGRFQQAQLAPMPRNFYAIYHGNGCPNGFIRTTPLPDLNWKPPPLQPISASEQCHTLNIYRCSNIPSQLLPVLVYFNEGHWLKRSNANLEPTSTIEQLACNKEGKGETPMLVVSINYRMGPFGHFHAPNWPEERRNFALWDIRTALEWIQRNIVHFGGHRAHVTVMARGHSARLVGLLGMLPQGKGLFKRQILLSGTPFSPTLFQPLPLPETAFDASMHFSVAANCANEREWRAMASQNGSQEMATKMEECLAGMGTEAIVAAESRVRAPAFLRWPLIVDGAISLEKSSQNFSLPKNPFLLEIPQIPSIIGICGQIGQNGEFGQNGGKKHRREPTQQGFKKRLAEALKEELAERMGQMGDLRRMADDFGGQVIGHYLDAIEGENGDAGGDGGNEPEMLMEKIRADFLEFGPALLDAFLHARLANAHAYGFTFECPSLLNISRVDSAERGARQTNEWASGQLGCIDDLLFNPMPKGFPKMAKLVGIFAQRVASFVTYSDPNPENDEGRNVLPNWPTAFSRELDLAGGFERKEILEQPKWLRMNEEKGEEILEGGNLVMGQNEGLGFWLCKLPKRMGIPKEICSKMEK